MIKEKNLQERLHYIPTGRYARYVKVLGNNYVTDTETFIPVVHHLRLMKTCLDRYYTVFPFAKNSPYTPYVDRKLGQLTAAGIIEHWFSNMTVKYGKSYMAELFDGTSMRRSQGQPLQLSNVIGAFYLLGAGLVVSGVVFLLELYIYNRRVKIVRTRH